MDSGIKRWTRVELFRSDGFVFYLRPRNNNDRFNRRGTDDIQQTGRFICQHFFQILLKFFSQISFVLSDFHRNSTYMITLLLVAYA